MGQIRCAVVTPERQELEVTGSFIVVPLYDGELGIGYNHSPLIGRLGFGELRVVDQGQVTHRYYIDGGFVQVEQNRVVLLTNRALPIQQLDAEAAHAQLRRALKMPALTEEQRAIRDRLIAQARTQIHLAGKR
ncbi:MAG: ATP synthase epsilon chain [Pirellulaceae bacterium]|nr:MAG: ATP synthase epsilon chain [Pirellulaceae bacterium]